MKEVKLDSTNYVYKILLAEFALFGQDQTAIDINTQKRVRILTVPVFQLEANKRIKVLYKVAEIDDEGSCKIAYAYQIEQSKLKH